VDNFVDNCGLTDVKPNARLVFYILATDWAKIYLFKISHLQLFEWRGKLLGKYFSGAAHKRKYVNKLLSG
jgi:hypothetical protein